MSEMKRPNTTSSNSNSNNPPTGNVVFNSYQKGGGNSSTNTATTNSFGYQPPSILYANDQTSILEDTSKTYYQVDEVAGRVLNQLTLQRQQILHAGEDVYQMQHTADMAKNALETLRTKYRHKKQRLYMWIAILSVADILLFLRMIQCHGNFYCW
jgi:hypothetical protein